MPRYFFDIKTAEGEPSPDHEGVEFSTEGEAEAFASGFAATLPKDDQTREPDRIVVRNNRGNTVAVITAEDKAPTQPDLGDGL